VGIFALACVAAPTTSSAQTINWGDVNADGTVGAVDAQAILTAVVGLPLPAGFTKANGDANCDAAIGAIDAQIVLSYVVALNVSQFCVGTLIGTSGTAASISVNSGNNQTASPGAVVAIPPSVVVKDANGNPVGGVSVSFEVTSGGGSISTVTIASNSSGIAAAGNWNLGVTVGANTLTATASGLAGSPIVFTATAQAKAIGIGRFFTCALTSSANDADCWGDNSGGALGDGTTVNRLFPTPVSGGLSFLSITGSCALTTARAAYCWNTTSTPTAVPGGLTFSSITGGGSTTCGILLSGQAYCWGSNGFGQVGNGTTTGPNNAPVAVVGDQSFLTVAMSPNGFAACGLTITRAAYCWGNNFNGQLGNGGTASSSVPVAVAGGLSFSSLSAGSGHFCGMVSTGSVYCWGANQFGQLGDGTTVDRSTPVIVSGGPSFTKIFTPGNVTCGLTAAGRAYCWGFNQYGQVGDGTTTDRSTPVPVVTSLSFDSIGGGLRHVCGLDRSGALWCWGYNADGELGDGTTTDRSTPVAVRAK
jgi:alpha-tubulin suppressor-like RCC1 family protein